jgi:hypothetical protein
VEELVKVHTVDDLIGLLAQAHQILDPQFLELPEISAGEPLIEMSLRHAAGSSPNIPNSFAVDAFGFPEVPVEEPTWEIPTLVRDLPIADVQKHS